MSKIKDLLAIEEGIEDLMPLETAIKKGESDEIQLQVEQGK